MNKTNIISSGGFAQLLTLVFVILKLCGVITWSWLWVLCPLWIGVALFIAYFLAVVVILLAVGMVLLTIYGIVWTTLAIDNLKCR